MTIKLFGAAVDVLDETAKIGLKLAYLDALKAGHLPDGLPADPYDAIVPLLTDMCDDKVTPAGKLDLPGWIRPRPQTEDAPLVTPERYRDFIDSEAVIAYSDSCAQWVAQLAPTDVPCLILVDHALSAGPLTALSARFGPDDLAVVVLDSHFDAIPAPLRAPPGIALPDSGLANCGSFLAALMEKNVMFPENLFIVGAADYPRKGVTAAYTKAYNAWLDRGVTVIPNDGHAETIGDRLAAALKNHPARYLYVSLDADVGSLNGLNAVRFQDHLGLDEQTVLGLAKTLNRLLAAGHFELAGLDIAEVDVHLLGLTGPDGEVDRTDWICAEFIQLLLAEKN